MSPEITITPTEGEEPFRPFKVSVSKRVLAHTITAIDEEAKKIEKHETDATIPISTGLTRLGGILYEAFKATRDH